MKSYENYDLQCAYESLKRVKAFRALRSGKNWEAHALNTAHSWLDMYRKWEMNKR